MIAISPLLQVVLSEKPDNGWVVEQEESGVVWSCDGAGLRSNRAEVF